MKQTKLGIFSGLALLLAIPHLQAANFGELEKLSLHFSAYEGGSLKLKGVDARRQLVVTGFYVGGGQRDLTRLVKYAVEPAGVAAIDKTGWVSPLKDGKAVITAKATEGATATTEITVEELGEVQTSVLLLVSLALYEIQKQRSLFLKKRSSMTMNRIL